jgi:hypothetical protein
MIPSSVAAAAEAKGALNMQRSLADEGRSGPCCWRSDLP